MRHGFSQWDEWNKALPNDRFFAVSNYGPIDAPECMPSGGTVWHDGPDGYAGQRTVMRER